MHILQDYSTELKIYHALSTYVENVTKNIINWMYYFPDHSKMLMGDVEDQIIYDTFRFQLNIKNQWVHFSISEIDKMKEVEGLFIYGAGRVGIEVLRILEILEIKVSAFIVSDCENNPDNVKGYAVISLEDFINNNTLIVIAVKYYDNIVYQLKKKKIENYICAVKV